MEPTAEKTKISNADFVLLCKELLAIARPDLEICRLVFGKDTPSIEAAHGENAVHQDAEYIVITFKGNATHLLYVDGNSHIANASEIFSKVASTSSLVPWNGDSEQTRIDFVVKCGDVLHVAKPNLVSCELKLGKDIAEKHANDGFSTLDQNKEYVVVTCRNGHTYTIEADGKSLVSIAAEIFTKMMHK